MKRVILFLLIAIILSGCGQKSVTESAVLTTETASTSSSATENTADQEEILLLYKRDITLQDPFVPTQDLSSFSYKELSVPASEAEPIVVTLEKKELRSDRIESSDGGVNAEYALTKMAEELKEKYPKIWSFLTEFNEFSEQNAILEISEGETRFQVYADRQPDLSYLYLNSWTGMEITRADSGIFSCFRTVYRYNRDIEPDYYEIYGRTMDSTTGRVLSLNDIFTDRSDLPQMIWEALVRSGWREETDSDKEELIEILRTAVQGVRDDGSFAWTVDPKGIEFALIESRTEAGEIRHIRERAYIPFRLCEGILRPGIADPFYDYMVHLMREDVEADTGCSVRGEDDAYTGFYIAQKSGKQHIYCAGDNFTDVYSATGETLEKTGETAAEISYHHNAHMSETLSPDHYKLRKTAVLLQELFMEADAHTGEDGIPVRDGYYTLTTNAMPIITGNEFEAEIFPDTDSDESSPDMISESTVLSIFRSDGESYIDCFMEDERLARLYVEGSESDGWKVNGHPMDEVIAQQGWFEE